MTKRIFGSGIATVGIGGAFALLGPILPAMASDSPTHLTDVEILDGSRLVAKGAGVVVPVEVTCEEGQTGFLFVDVAQARGRFVANGGGSTQVACDGTTQLVEVFATAQSGAFKRGTAVASAFLSVCGAFPCQEDRDTEEITLSTA